MAIIKTFLCLAVFVTRLKLEPLAVTHQLIQWRHPVVEQDISCLSPSMKYRPDRRPSDHFLSHSSSAWMPEPVPVVMGRNSQDWSPVPVKVFHSCPKKHIKKATKTKNILKIRCLYPITESDFLNIFRNSEARMSGSSHQDNNICDNIKVAFLAINKH